MCGILGQFSSTNILNKNQFLNTLNILNHRGPDDYGIEGGFINDFNFFIGHKRLSIIDLTKSGNQPFKSEDNRFILVFNGEIYNYLELKKELSNLGFTFNSTSDTEVLLNAWICWGVDSIEKLIGMFSFGILDKSEMSLHIVRDGFGIKPLFYSFNDNCSEIIFASEINPLRSLSKEKKYLNTKKTYEYLAHSLSDYEEETFLNDIYSLKQGHYIKFDLNKRNREINRWWKPNIKNKFDITYQEAKIEVRKRFLKNIEMHLRSDVDIPTTLSGGIDSTAIVSSIKHLKPDLKIESFTYSASSNSLNEVKWSNIVTRKLDIKNNLVNINIEEFKDDIKELIKSQGEPFGSTSIYASYKVFKAIKDKNFKVVLEGQGGDEVLGGYDGYPYAKIRNYLNKGDFFAYLNFLKNLSKNNLTKLDLLKISAKGFLPLTVLNKISLSNNFNKFNWLNIRNITEKEKLEINYYSRDNIKRYFQNNENNLSNYLYQSIDNYGLSSLLRYGDRNSMANSIENRVPFLTTDFAEFMLRLPDDFLVSNKGITKSIFKESMRDIIPTEIIQRKDKIGFQTPEFELIKILMNDIDEFIDIAKEIPFLNYKNLKKYLLFLIKSKKNFDWISWRIINFCYWFKINKLDIKN